MRKRIISLIRFDTTYAGQELFVAAGLLMVVATFLKLIGVIYIDSDWYWFIAGVGLTIEGLIMIKKQRQFNRKYKVIEREALEDGK